MCSENQTNVTELTRIKEEESKEPYDHLGAMQFIIAVIVVYSGSVTAMFIVRIFRKRFLVTEKRDLDAETDSFLKTMPKIRVRLEQENKQRTIQQLEKMYSFQEKEHKGTTMFGRNLAPLFALPMTLGGIEASDISGEIVLPTINANESKPLKSPDQCNNVNENNDTIVTIDDEQ